MQPNMNSLVCSMRDSKHLAYAYDIKAPHDKIKCNITRKLFDIVTVTMTFIHVAQL